MEALAGLIFVDSGRMPATSCLVCDNEVPAGEGITAVLGGRTLRFKCPGCVTRFEADPERYLAGQTTGCCKDGHADAPVISDWA